MRPAPSGRDSAASGYSSRPEASSSEPPPMSMRRMLPADQPNQRRTARKVTRASSSPLMTLSSTPVSCRIRSIVSSPLGADLIAEVANARICSDPWSSAISIEEATKSMSLFWP